MANIFSGNTEKRIPKSFKECYETDGITQNLWQWCERIEKWGLRICIALAVIGVISIISSGIEAAKLLDELNIDANEIRVATAEYGIEIKPVFVVVVEEIFSWLLYCFLEYCTYHILALFIGSLATIVQHTKITANITLYNSAKAEGFVDDNNSAKEKANARRKCNNRTHDIYISEMKDTETDSENAHWEESKLTGVKKLVCNHCGKELTYIDNQEKTEEEETFSEEDYKEVRCPKCKQKLSVHLDEKNLICPFCEADIHVD